MTFNASEHITKIQGREYLEVKWRLVWFRDQHPTGSIATEIISTSPTLVKATVAIDGVIVATAHGSAEEPEGKRVVWAGKGIEKAETAAIGRALAHAGFGTQFTEDDDVQVVDSPVVRNHRPVPAPAADELPPAPEHWATNGGGVRIAAQMNALGLSWAQIAAHIEPGRSLNRMSETMLTEAEFAARLTALATPPEPPPQAPDPAPENSPLPEGEGQGVRASKPRPAYGAPLGGGSH